MLHVPDTDAPWVISSVNTVKHLVTEVLQSAVGNFIREKLQATEAVTFITSRHKVQEESETFIRRKLAEYRVEVKGVCIQDMKYPEGCKDTA